MMKGLVLSPIYRKKKCPDSERFSKFPKAFSLVSCRAEFNQVWRTSQPAFVTRPAAPIHAYLETGSWM